MTRAHLFVISAPSGTGKTTIRGAIEKKCPGIRFAVSLTTREPRPGEKDGVDYYFIDKQEFQAGIESGRFLEWAEVFENYYGTDRQQVEELLKKGYQVILDIDVKGASQVKAHFPDVTTIFVLPPSMDALEKRLRKRGTEDDVVVIKRLETARWEISQAPWFDYVVVNDQLDEAIFQVRSILTAFSCKRESSIKVLKRFLDVAK